jgi:hypothetical protein
MTGGRFHTDFNPPHTRRKNQRDRRLATTLRGIVFLPGGLLFALLFAGIASSSSSQPQIVASASTVPGEVFTDRTFENAGIEWFIDGDDDLDCRVQVRFRPVDEMRAWREAQPLLRVEPGSYNEYGVDPGNLLAGSLFGLTPGTEYEIVLDLTDPDGGAASETLQVTTRSIPAGPAQPRVRYVVPGSGGGTGTPSDPFRGFAAADLAAAAGDLFLVQPGTYTGAVGLTASGTEGNPIVWRGLDQAAVILDGEGTAKPLIDLPGSRYVQIENMTLRRPRQMAIRGTSTEGVVVRDCIIDVTLPTGYLMAGIRLEGPGQQDATIWGNTIKGPLHWEDGRDEEAYGIVVVGKGHVIAYNEISGWYDAICVGADDPGSETGNCDIYRNEVFDCTDDGIETDGSRHNIRVIENRITNVLCGLSCQPVYGGPAYLIRNVVYNFQLKPLKFHVWPTGVICFHNTLVGADPRGWGGGQWRNVITRNNLFVGGSQVGYSGSPIPISTTAVRVDLDYDGWYQARPGRFAILGTDFYPSIEAFTSQTGLEAHGLLLDIGVFEQAEEPPLGSYLGVGGFPPAYAAGSQDLRLRESAVCVDAGLVLENINDSFEGSAPDLGAYERGLLVPIYGPAGEPAPIAGLPPSTRSGVILSEGFPNPFQDRIRFCLDGSGGFATIEIFDAGGRLVRSLRPDGEGSTEGLEFVWDGRDGRGRGVPPGAYLCQFWSPSGTYTRKILKIR